MYKKAHNSEKPPLDKVRVQVVTCLDARTELRDYGPEIRVMATAPVGLRRRRGW